MKYYEYQVIKMDPMDTDNYTILEMLNEHGWNGFRLVSTQKLWSMDKDRTMVERDYLILEKEDEKDEDDC